MEYPSFPILSTSIIFTIMAVRIWKKLKFSNASHQNLPPGPRKLPVIGGIHLLFGSLPHRGLSDLAKKYGAVMHLQLGEVTNIIISSPETAKQVMQTHDIVFAQRPFMLAASIISYNNTDIAFAPYGEYWRQLRKICTTELLSLRRVESFRSVREEETSKLVRDIYDRAGSPINVTRTLQALNYGIISRAAFGKIWNDKKGAFIPVVMRIVKALGGFSLADLYPSVKWLHYVSGIRRNADRIHQELDQIMEDIISDHRRKNSVVKTESDNEEDLVDVLLNLQSQGNLQFPLSTNSIKAVILDMYAGGSETSSTVLEWAMSELMRNPEVMKKTQAEIRQVFGENRKVDETRCDELNYLRFVIKETLRLHPPFPLLLPRENSKKCEINGYEIPAKSKVIVNAWAIGRDPNCWVEADKFIPERFLDGSLIDYRGTNFEFIPFGAGRRICPGMLFSMATVEHALSALLYHFDWKLPGDMKPEDFDMAEFFGIAVKRKNNLMLIPFPHFPLQI